MTPRTTGQYTIKSTIGEEVCAFTPFPLPPDPPFQISASLQVRLENASLALGRLDCVTTLLPDRNLFLYMYVRKEAVLSSMIEGTQSSLSDLLLFELEEAPHVPVDDVQEVSNYVAALNHGLKRLREGFPLCNRLLREIHEILLSTGRGAGQGPGEFRLSQNWIGGSRPGNARYVPPPPEQVPECMGALEKFLNDKTVPLPVLIKAALAHVQFETIHPFLDGNGRLGRLLITFVFSAEGVLREPILYLSLYLKAHRDEYYALLQRVRTEGDWERWVEFFADAVEDTARQAVETVTALVKLAEEDRRRIQELKRISGTVLLVHRVLLEKPLITAAKLASATGLTVMTVTAALHSLEKLEIIKEITGKRRNRVYSYRKYIEVLSQGLEPLSPGPGD
jgi:Fic family protein